MDSGIEIVTVSVEKPDALPFVDGAGVEIMRDRNFFRDAGSSQAGST